MAEPIEKDIVMASEQKRRPSNWEGDYRGHSGTLARDLQAYRQARTLQNLRAEIPWQSTLYSAANRARLDLWRPQAVVRVFWVLSHWRPIAQLFISRADVPGYIQSLCASDCEVIGANLLGYSRIPVLGGARARDGALRYALEANSQSVADVGGHVFELSALTLGRIDVLNGNLSSAREHLSGAQRDVPAITDRDQRARVYRGIAELTMSVYGGSPVACLDATEALDAADAIPGIGADVRYKTAAMRKQLGL